MGVMWGMRLSFNKFPALIKFNSGIVLTLTTHLPHVTKFPEEISYTDSGPIIYR